MTLTEAAVVAGRPGLRPHLRTDQMSTASADHVAEVRASFLAYALIDSATWGRGQSFTYRARRAHYIRLHTPRRKFLRCKRTPRQVYSSERGCQHRANSTVPHLKYVRIAVCDPLELPQKARPVEDSDMSRFWRGPLSACDHRQGTIGRHEAGGRTRRARGRWDSALRMVVAEVWQGSVRGGRPRLFRCVR